MEQGRKKVYINPNFNKDTNVPLRNVPIMHVNPNFYQHLQNTSLHKPKIYVNPNFVRPNGANNHQIQYSPQFYTKPSPLMDSSNTLATTVSTPSRHIVQSSVENYIENPIIFEPIRQINPDQHLKHTSTDCHIKPGLIMENANTLTASISGLSRCKVQSNLQTKSVSTQPYKTNSRYSLVRQKKTEEAVNNITKPQTSTMKISKHKSIKITDVKKNLDCTKPCVKISNNHKSLTRPILSNQKVTSKTPTKHINRYKLVRATVVMGQQQFKRQISSTPKKVLSSQTKIKGVGVYKKNNVPCPQYRKYGKCLRKLYGKCEYLHDRKHVSICRKFLSGVCHNNDCLLSHELSDKKMPTCYFYLKGKCTKDSCPYLHVKLNEKAKSCLDFLKGYCEKGDKCLNRHVCRSLNIGHNRKLILKKDQQQKLMKFKLEKNKFQSCESSTFKRKSKVELKLQDNNDAASRYYKESIGEQNISENLKIKPTRCKLGTLPSFIQL